MTPMGGDDYSGFEGRGKVVTYLKDGRKFVAEEEDLGLITAIELVVSDEIKEEYGYSAEVSKKVTENRTSDDIKDIYEKDINRMLCMNNIDDIKDYLYDITESCNFDEAKSWLNGIKNYAGKNLEQNSEIIKSCDEILKDTFYENKKLNETIEYEKDYQAIFSEIDLKDIGSAVYDCIKECKLSEAAVQVILNKLHSSYGIVTESKKDDEYNYMLLDRLKSDCDYYLGNGNRNPKHLWAGNEQGQIDKMKELYNKLPEKPEWLTMEQIEDYAKQMDIKELPSTENGTAEKEINDMLSRSFNLKNNVGIE